MINIINLPIPATSKILVEVGDNITNKTLLWKFPPGSHIETIHLAKLLGVSNNKISKYLQIQVGENIESGDIIAQKKGILSSSIVRSPLKGKLVELDLTGGIVSLSKFPDVEKEAFLSPVEGKVTSISKSFIEIEINNSIFKSEKSQGKEVMGKLQYIREEKLSILQSYNDIENSIVLCLAASEAILAKFSVIGVAGVIMVSYPKEKDLTWMQVNEGTFEKLIKFSDKKIWLRPDEKQIIIIE